MAFHCGSFCSGSRYGACGAGLGATRQD